MSEFSIISTDFKEGEEIPKKFGYKFENTAPDICLKNLPEDTNSLALIMDDPDAMVAVGKIWVHWLVCNISPNQDLKFSLEKFQGKTDFDEIGYGGPAPPDKRHTYVFRGYALDVESLHLKPGYSKQELEESMKDHILAEAKLTGTFTP